MSRVILIVAVLLAAVPAAAFDSPWPEEAERYDAEHILDVLTMRRDREWRDLWYARDNNFYMGFGSLNVELWRFDQRLKLAAPIGDRWRVRFRMERLDGLDPVSRDRHELELEFRAAGPWYASLLLDLAALKRENDVGFALQRRTAVDRFVTLAVRVRDAANDYAMRHGDLIEGEERLYAAQPVEVALSAREELGERVRLGIDARATNEWELGVRPIDTAGEPRTEWGFERDLA
ncbi:MAG TPA: hypothetical protein ENO23_04680, partial [Alphaproteobacteria bacterium]|nr:hypothetical protein [Alphaproteobacteria bacterium]